MSSTFTGRLTGDEGRKLVRYVTIQGLPHLFTTGQAAPPAAVQSDIATRIVMRTVCSIKRAKKKIDPEKLRMVGGSLEVILNDDAAGTLTALFAHRSRRSSFLITDVDTATASLDVDDSSPFPNNATIYVGGESVVVDTTPDPTVIDLFGRGAWGSEAQPHFGDAENGAGVFLTPPSWKGRRVTLRGYFLNDDGGSTADLAQTLDTFRLEAAPEFIGNGQWKLTCSHLSDEFAVRKIGTGLKEVTPTHGLVRFDLTLTDAAAYIEVESVEQFVVGDFTTYVRAEFDDGSVRIWPLLSVDDALLRIYIDFGGNLVEGSPGHVNMTIKSVRHIALLLDTDIGRNAAMVLTSRLGTAANGALDELPGFKRTTFGGDEWRFGAGILAAEVDVDAFRDVGAGAPIPWSYVIDEEMPLADFLFDFCLATGSFWYVTAAGLLSVKRLAEERVDAVMNVDNGMVIGKASVSYAEEGIYPRVLLTCNYDAAARDFEGDVTLLDPELADRYPTDDSRLEIETRGIVTMGINRRIPGGGAAGTLKRPPALLGDVELLLRRIQAASGRGPAFVSFRGRLPTLQLDLGDIVLLSLDHEPDLEGNATITNRTARVIEYGPDDEKGSVTLVLAILDTLFHVAPASVIASTSNGVGAAALTLDLQTTGPEVSSVTPGRMFGDGWVVRIFDISAGVFFDRQIFTHTDTSLTLTVAVGFVVEAGVDFVSLQPQDANHGVTIESDNGFIPDEFLYTMERDLQDADPVTRWR